VVPRYSLRLAPPEILTRQSEPTLEYKQRLPAPCLSERGTLLILDNHCETVTYVYSYVVLNLFHLYLISSKIYILFANASYFRLSLLNHMVNYNAGVTRVYNITPIW